jgi:hypothetical protein
MVTFAERLGVSFVRPTGSSVNKAASPVPSGTSAGLQLAAVDHLLSVPLPTPLRWSDVAAEPAGSPSAPVREAAHEQIDNGNSTLPATPHPHHPPALAPQHLRRDPSEPRPGAQIGNKWTKTVNRPT